MRRDRRSPAYRHKRPLPWLEPLEDRRVLAVGVPLTLVIVVPAPAALAQPQGAALLSPLPATTDHGPSSMTSSPSPTALGNPVSDTLTPGQTTSATPTPTTSTPTGSNGIGPFVGPTGSSTGSNSTGTGTGTGMGTGTGNGTTATGGQTTTGNPGQSPSTANSNLSGTNAAPNLAPLATVALESPPVGFNNNPGQTTGATFNAPPPITFGAQGTLAPFLVSARGPNGYSVPTDGSALQRAELAQALGLTLAGQPSVQALSARSGGAGQQENQEQPPPAETAPPNPDTGDEVPAAWWDDVGQLDARPQGDLERAVDEALQEFADADLAGWLAREATQPWVLGLAVAGTTLELTRRRSQAVGDDEEDEAGRKAWRHRLDRREDS
jgi:hypothetical protein